jgi:hypothetical protein
VGKVAKTWNRLLTKGKECRWLLIAVPVAYVCGFLASNWWGGSLPRIGGHLDVGDILQSGTQILTAIAVALYVSHYIERKRTTTSVIRSILLEYYQQADLQVRTAVTTINKPLGKLTEAQMSEARHCYRSALHWLHRMLVVAEISDNTKLLKERLEATMSCIEDQAKRCTLTGIDPYPEHQVSSADTAFERVTGLLLGSKEIHDSMALILAEIVRL